MRPQAQLGAYLNQILTSHTIVINGNKIYGKKAINHRSFSNFVITYLKNGMVSLKIGNWSERYDNESELMNTLRGVASFIEGETK